MKSNLPSDITTDLLQAVRSAFYQDLSDKRFHQDTRLLTQWVITWPANWLRERGVSMKPKRYKSLLLELIQEARNHCQIQVKSPPRYLATCIQKHFEVHGEEYYCEGKAARDQIGDIIDGINHARNSGPDPVEILAQVHRVLAKPKPQGRRNKTGKKPAAQTQSQIELL